MFGRSLLNPHAASEALAGKMPIGGVRANMQCFNHSSENEVDSKPWNWRWPGMTCELMASKRSVWTLGRAAHVGSWGGEASCRTPSSGVLRLIFAPTWMGKRFKGRGGGTCVWWPGSCVDGCVWLPLPGASHPSSHERPLLGPLSYADRVDSSCLASPVSCNLQADRSYDETAWGRKLRWDP